MPNHGGAVDEVAFLHWWTQWAWLVNHSTLLSFLKIHDSFFTSHPLSSSQLHHLIIHYRDDHHRQGIDHGAPGGRAPPPSAVELQRRPRGAEFPHSQRLLLQSQRRVQLLRREHSQGGPQQGAGALLPNGREAPPGRRRSRGD